MQKLIFLSLNVELQNNKRHIRMITLMISDHNLPPKPQFMPVALILLLKVTSFINDNILVLIANTVGFTGRGSKKNISEILDSVRV